MEPPLDDGLPGGDPRGERIEVDVLRSTIERETMKDMKRIGARMVRERKLSLALWWWVVLVVVEGGKWVNGEVGVFVGIFSK